MTELSPEAKKLMRIAREEFSPADQRVSAVRGALELRIHLARGSGGGGAGGAGALGAGAWGVGRMLCMGLVAATLGGVGVIAARSLTQGREARTTQRVEPVISAPIEAAPVQTAGVTEAANDGEAVAHAALRSAVSRPPQISPRATVAAALPAPRVPVLSAARVPARADRPRASRPAATPVAQTTGVSGSAPALRSGAVSGSAPALRGGAVSGAAPALRGGASSADSVAPEVAAPAREEAPAPPVVDDSLAREIALLSRARAALERHDPRAALALADQHAALFANGTMRQERLATRVLALCALGRKADAVASKRELERIAPRSPHWMRIRATCAGEGASNEY